MLIADKFLRLAGPTALACIFVSPVAAQEGQSASASILLDPVVVTANRTATPARAVGSAVTVITRAELESRQVRLVSDALRHVPGVAVSRSGTVGNLTSLRVRGAEANQTLVLIDGVEVNDPAMDSGFDFAHLLAQDVERIEVLRGPQSALYGSDAIGGVVNIVTRKGEGEPSASIRMEGGSRGTASGALSVGGAHEKADFFISLGGLSTDGFSSAAEWNGNPENDGYRNGTGFAKFGFNATDDLRFDFVGRVTAFRSEFDENYVDGALADSDSDAKGRQVFGRAQARLDTWEGRWQHIASVSRSHSNTRYYWDGLPNGEFTGEKTKYDYQSNLFLSTPGEVPLAHTITFLAEHEEESAKSESAWASFDESIGQTGLVGQYQLGIADDFFLTGSLRHDFNEKFGDATTYRVTAAYNIERTGTKLRGSYGTGVKNPTLFELYGYTGTYSGNPDLKPEKARGWDIGFDQWLLQDLLLAEVTYFDQRITNLIQGAGETSVNLDGTAPIHGVELALTATPVEDLVIRAAYTWLDGEDADGVTLNRRPEHTASFDIGYTFLDGDAHVDLGIVYTGAQKDLIYDAFFNASQTELDAYTLVNLAGSYRLRENAEVFGRIENLFDERYEEVYGYGSAGRTAVAGVKVTF